MGTGLFVGDNLNPNFPEGDGVQTFLTFDLGGVAGPGVESAILSSVPPEFSGTPLADLGNLIVEEVRYDSFSSALWNLEPEAGGRSCVYAMNQDSDFQCDITDIVENSFNDSYSFVQLRLRLENAGDSDGQQDLVLFFNSDSDSNTNEPGLFNLDITFSDE